MKGNEAERERVCELCEQERATVVCGADAVILCETCDADIHPVNTRMGHHVRIPLSFSPHHYNIGPDSLLHVLNGAKTLMTSSSQGMTSSTQGMTDREARVMRYKEKKKSRKFEKKTRYASRKVYAETRPRIKGRFVKIVGPETEKEEQDERNK